MGKLSDALIKSWVNKKQHFSAKSDGNGLYIRFDKGQSSPSWRFRYKQSWKEIGSYPDVSLAEARKIAHKMRAKITLGVDPILEIKLAKQESEATTARLKAEITVSDLADLYIRDRITGKVKHPNIPIRYIERDIKPFIGSRPAKELTVDEAHQLLMTINSRGKPTVTNKVHSTAKAIFKYGTGRLHVPNNPFAHLTIDDAGGKERPRERCLTDQEITMLFSAMSEAKGWGHVNYLTIKLLLLLLPRKEELIAAKKEEFDLDNRIWHLPAERTKTKAAIRIPLSKTAADCLQSLFNYSGTSDWLLPARKQQTRLLPHIAPDTLNAGLKAKIEPLMTSVDHFTIHDFRRTSRSLLSQLKTPPHIAEKCLNHKLPGIMSVYDTYDYFEERLEALENLANHINNLEQQAGANQHEQ